MNCILFLPGIASAQLCTGSLGDPVVNITFGAGTSPIGPALANGITNYTYVANNFPQDGYYTIENTTAGGAQGWWVTTDHTGNAGGYMMMVNARTSVSDYFYKQTVTGLCGNTTYEFASWIMNLLKTSDVSPPNIEFTIESTAGGPPLRTYTTGTIARENSPIWKQFGFNFTTPPGVTDVVLTMKNISPGGGPANDLVLDDITFRPCGPEIKAHIEVPDDPTTLETCSGATTSYNLKAEINANYPNPDYQWQVNKNNTGWADIPNATTLATTVSQSAAGTYQYRLSVGEGAVSASCHVVSSVVTITVKDPPAIVISTNSPVCAGDILSLNATGGATFQWSGPDNFTSNIAANGISTVGPAQSGTYTVTVTTTGGCTSSASVDVVVSPRPIVSTSGDIDICEGSSTTLNASGGTTYLWSPATGLSDPNIANPVATPTATTVYTVTVTSNSSPCPAQEEVTVKVVAKPVADAGPDKNMIKGNSVQLSGKVSGTNISYFWTPTDFLDDPNLLNPVASPDKNITYTLNVSSAAGCAIAQDQVMVTVYGKIVIPNTFSPNGDGVNEVWNVTALDGYTRALVSVFNRNGSLVYKSTGYDKPWDGTNNGSLLPVGTYYYTIDLRNNTPVLSGWIWLTR